MPEMVSLAASIPLDAAKSGAVCLSKRATTNQVTAQDVNKFETKQTMTQGDMKNEDTQPFTPEQLSEAMTAVTIRPDR